MPSRERSATKEMIVRRKRIAVLLMLGVVLVTSCSSDDGDGPRAGVGVRAINTNIGLGVELEAAAPANIAVPARRPGRSIGRGPESTIPPFEFDAPKPVNRACPAAGPFDFPAEETGVVPQGRPKAGPYPWKLDGKVYLGTGVIDVDDFETRTISNVEDHPEIPGAFRYDVSQPNYADTRQGRGLTTTTYRVVPDSAVESEQVASDAGKGMYIEKIAFEGTTQDGEKFSSSITPVPAVQLIGFPVEDGAGNAGSAQTGQPITTSSGVDPASGAQVTISGTVKGKKQVDACGDRVDAWFVDATITYRYPNENGQNETYEANYDYGIATQYGSLLVYEHIDAPLEGPVAQIDFRIGEVPERAG